MFTNLEIGQRCSEVTRELELDSGGTALRADFFLAIDAPLPWPKPVLNHELLTGVTELLDNYSSSVRLLASVPENNDQLTVTAYELKQSVQPGKSLLERTQWIFQPSNLLETLENALDGKRSENFRNKPQEQVEEVRELWICTQGSHDVCCGSEGTSLYLEAEANLQEVKVRRVSHLGGHRFAPTAVTFPDGRMWSHLNMENLYQIFNQTPVDEKLIKKNRGWCGLKKGPEQIAEREGLNLYGWNWDKYQRKTVVVSENDSEIKVLVTGVCPESQCEIKFDVVLAEIEKTPVLSCDQAGNPPDKWQSQYEVKAVNG